MVDVVVIVTMVNDYLVKTTLVKTSLIDFLPGIFVICITNCFCELFFISQRCIIETLYGSEKAQVQ